MCYSCLQDLVLSLCTEQFLLRYSANQRGSLHTRKSTFITWLCGGLLIIHHFFLFFSLKLPGYSRQGKAMWVCSCTEGLAAFLTPAHPAHVGTVNSCSCATAFAYTHCLRKNKSLVWQLLLLLFFAAVSYSSLSFCVFHSSLRWRNCKMHEGQMQPAGWPWRWRGKEHGRSWGWHSVLCTHKSTWICPKQPTPSSCSLQRWGCCGIAASPAQPSTVRAPLEGGDWLINV